MSSETKDNACKLSMQQIFLGGERQEETVQRALHAIRASGKPVFYK
jgi:hypothetical protein